MSDTQHLSDEEIRDAIDAEEENGRNQQFYEENSGRINEEYAGQLVAISNEEIIGSRDSSADLHELDAFFNDLRRTYGESTARNAYVTRIGGEDEVLIL